MNFSIVSTPPSLPLLSSVEDKKESSSFLGRLWSLCSRILKGLVEQICQLAFIRFKTPASVKSNIPIAQVPPLNLGKAVASRHLLRTTASSDEFSGVAALFALQPKRRHYPALPPMSARYPTSSPELPPGMGLSRPASVLSTSRSRRHLRPSTSSSQGESPPPPTPPIVANLIPSLE